MVIAVNTRGLTGDESNAPANFIYETFSRITMLHPGHTFIFIDERPTISVVDFPPNVIHVSRGSHGENPLQWYIWYNVKIPGILKKYKAEVFVSLDGLCSLTTKTPQCLFVPSLAFLHGAHSLKKAHLLFYKYFMPRFIRKARVVVTTSQSNKSAIIKKYDTNADKVEVIFSGTNEKFMPVDADQREHAKAKYAGGNEYFIYTGDTGSDNNLLNLLKAFSAFKKRQKSNMQLLITGTSAGRPATFSDNLRLFRFKEEVKFLDNPSLPELAMVTASAYAMVYPTLLDTFCVQCLQAIKSGIPVITSPDSAAAEICGEAALYADPLNFKEIAVQMMLIFKDENLRKNLIEKAKLQAENYTWDATASLFWNAIEKTIA